MKNLLIFVLFCSTLLGLSSCEDNNQIEKVVVSVDEKYYVEINKDTLLILVNEARTSGYQCGDTYYPPVGEVEWNDKLEEAARLNSNYMFQFKTIGHVWSDFTNGGDRITSVGYDWSAYGENAAWGNMTETTVVQGWLNSPGHCKNMMKGVFKFMGVTRTGDYWTQVFAN